MHSKHLMGALALGIALLVPPPHAAAAAASADKVEQFPVIPYVHTRWLLKDGVPPNVSALAQTPDGWIWLASSVGLFRFDGVTFSRYRPPAGTEISGGIETLHTLSDGSLCVVTRFGEGFMLHGEKFVKVDVPGVKRILRDSDGNMWAASSRGLYRREEGGASWRDVGSESGLPAGGVAELFQGYDGTVWLMARSGNYRRAKGAARFERVSDQVGWGMFGQAPDGSVWATDMGIGGMRRLTPAPHDRRQDKLLSGANVSNFIVDRRGNMWFGMYGGLARAELDTGNPVLQTFTRKQGFSGDHTDALLEDREGNIWAASGTGLDQFRAPRVKEIVMPTYLSEARPVAAGPDGDLWIDRFHLASPDAAPQPYTTASSQTSGVASLYRDPDGIVWSGALDGLWRVEGLKRIRVPYPPEFRRWQQIPIFAMAKDTQKGLWISVGPRGTWRLHDGSWTAHGGVAELAGLPATTMVSAPDGSLWFGSLKNTVAVLKDGKVRKYGRVQGISIGNTLQILPTQRGAYLGGDEGIAYFENGHARRITGAGGESFPGATGLVAMPNGDLWLNTAKGVARIAAEELTRARSDPTRPVDFRMFDENDGLRGGAAALLPLPSMVLTTGGELIVSTISSVFRLDPAKLVGNKLAPPVHITGITTGGTAHAPKDGLKLPAAPGTVRIDFTALSLALPQRVRFRYMLEGVDRGWQDAGTRRSAFYTQLAPGRYFFRVMAANEDGVWNEKGAAVRFVVPPTWTQTIWFKLLSTALLLAAVWMLHRLRLQVALRRIGMSMEARDAERERIARELHDTLLQSVQGLLLMFQRIAKMTPDTEPSKPLMNKALAYAIDIMEEGRNKVGELRREAANDHEDLTAALAVYGQRLSEQHGSEFELLVNGRAKVLRIEVADELLSIAREGLNNAFAHSHAQRVTLELNFHERLFELCVRDNGRGIDARYREGRTGHWGITGLRERARQLGATLELSTGAGQGAEWRLQMAGRLAYDRRREQRAAT